MTDEELGRKIVPAHMSLGYRDADYAVVGDNARKALAHFAPPPSRIAGMTVEELLDTMQKECGDTILISWAGLTACAHVAHRLAREPAVDRDAGAKRIAEKAGLRWGAISERGREALRIAAAEDADDAVAAQQEKRDA